MVSRACLLLIVCFTLGSCDRAGPAQGVAWEFERDGSRVLLLPTVHVGSQKPPKLSAALKDRLFNSSSLLVELNIRAPDVLRELQDCRHLSLGNSNTQISEEVADRMVEVFPEIRDELRKDPPSTSSAMSFVVWQTKAHHRLHAKHGLDTQIIDLFGRSGKTILSLERPCAQMIMIGHATAVATNSTVLEALEIYLKGDLATWVDQFYVGWRDGSWQYMKCSTLKFDRRYPHQKLANAVGIDQRNPELAQAISKAAVDKPLVVAAVGVRHFVGNNSLPRELLSLGFRTNVDITEWTGPCDEPNR